MGAVDAATDGAAEVESGADADAAHKTPANTHSIFSPSEWTHMAKEMVEPTRPAPKQNKNRKPQDPTDLHWQGVSILEATRIMKGTGVTDQQCESNQQTHTSTTEIKQMQLQICLDYHIRYKQQHRHHT